jgi:hypothetical protein
MSELASAPRFKEAGGPSHRAEQQIVESAIGARRFAEMHGGCAVSGMPICAVPKAVERQAMLCLPGRGQPR